MKLLNVILQKDIEAERLKTKKGNPFLLSIQMYLLFCCCFSFCIETKFCFTYGGVLRGGDIQNILQCVVL